MFSLFTSRHNERSSPRAQVSQAMSAHEDVLGNIMDKLDPRDLTACAQVCEHWRMVADQPARWEALAAPVKAVGANAGAKVREAITKMPLASQADEALAWHRYVPAAFLGASLTAAGVTASTMMYSMFVNHRMPPVEWMAAYMAAMLCSFLAIPCTTPGVDVLMGIRGRNKARRQARRHDDVAEKRLAEQSFKRQTMQRLAVNDAVVDIFYDAIKYNDAGATARILTAMGNKVSTQQRVDPMRLACHHRSWDTMVVLHGVGFPVSRELLLQLVTAGPGLWRAVAQQMGPSATQTFLSELTATDIVALVRSGAANFDILEDCTLVRRRHLVEGVDVGTGTCALDEAPGRIDAQIFVRWLLASGRVAAIV